MRRGVLLRVASRLLWFAVAALSVPLVVSIAAAERIWWAWAIPLVIASMFAYALVRLPEAIAAPRDSLRRREGFIAVTFGWLVIVFFTALAYHLAGAFGSFAGSFFEAMSGYTTTGATVAIDIEALPRSVLMMRSFSHWFGGMGIIVLSVAILPELSVGGLQLFSAESSAFESDKLAPRIAATARRLWTLYFGITAVLTALLWVGPLNLFDAVNHAMATVATGGFSTKNASVGHYDSVYVELVLTLFMFLGGLSFILQYRAIVDRSLATLWRSPEVRLYTTIAVGACLLVALNLTVTGTDPLDALRQSLFTTTSILTTTGFGTADFDTWPDFSRVLLIVLMLIGGCAGSTAGGSKIIRLYVLVKHAGAQMRKLIRPRLVESLHIGEREIARDATEGILGFYLLYAVVLAVLSMAMTALGLDFISGTSAAVSAMNSIGPGMGSVGAAEPYTHVPAAGLYLMSAGMLLGRLEIYPVLVLFTSHFWRRG